jgi:arylsulfatase
VSLETDGAVHPLWERVVDVAGTPADRRWFDYGLDLGAFAGRRGTLRFETAPAAADGLPGTLALWARPELATCDGNAPSVLVVVLDALRADHLGAWGYARPTSPHLDRFAAGATRATAAFAGAPKTVPSVPQLLTGSYLFHHRATPGLEAFLPAGRFAATRAIVNNPHVSGWLTGEQPGFATVVSGDLDARAITSAALRFLTAAGRCPTALYLHYLDTHTPYRSPPRFARRFVDPRAATTIGLEFGDVSAVWQGRFDAPADRQRIIDLYDGAIAWTDHQLGRLFRGLARRHLLDRTLVVVTADHGEELWDHGQFFHGQSLFDELLHVPLVVRLPGQTAGRAPTEIATVVDVVPTVRDVLGVPPVPGDGRSLRTLGDGAPAPRAVFATVSYAEPRTPPRQAVRSHTHKLIRSLHRDELALYDLARDAKERTPLDPETAPGPTLRAALDAFRAPLRATGDHVRLASRADHPVSYVLTLATEPAVPLVDPDVWDAEAGDHVGVGPRSSAVTLAGTLAPGDSEELRVDVLAGTGTLVVTLVLDGKPAPAGTLRLGRTGRAATGRVALDDRGLATATPVGPAADAPPVTATLWRIPRPDPAGAPAVREVDAATRARLRELGYVE